MAQDLKSKRQHLIASSISAATEFVDALNVLLQLREERMKLIQDFQDSDFVTGLDHCTPAMIGTLYDFVVPSIQACYEDLGINGGRNKQILLQVRK